MKLSLFIMGCSIVLYCCISNARQQNRKESNFAAEGIDSVNYISQVLPILQKKCSPCHFAGGKMYEKMPFDNSATIISHEAGVLKRFKDEQEIVLIKEFIHQRSH